MKTKLIPILIGALVAAAGCEPIATAPAASHFSASIAGDSEESFAGTGFFVTNLTRMPSGPVSPEFFFLYSRGSGAHTIQFSRSSSELPAVGSHTIGRPEGEVESSYFNASYSRNRGTTTELYTARSGELNITYAGDDRIDGTFRFEAVATGVCHRSGGAVSCMPTTTPEEDKFVIEVQGAFQAVPGRHSGPGSVFF